MNILKAKTLAFHLLDEGIHVHTDSRKDAVYVWDRKHTKEIQITKDHIVLGRLEDDGTLSDSIALFGLSDDNIFRLLKIMMP